MDLVDITETYALPAAGEAGVLIGEAVREAGLDPAHYLAVLPAECGRAGRLNLNGRIYVPEELRAEHARLSEEAQSAFVDGELGHPEAGPTWNVAIRFLGGDVVNESDGSALARGRIGVLNTTAGRDVYTLWQAGLPIGMSKRALGCPEDHRLDESSPYRPMNPGHEGAAAKLVRRLKLQKYDVVRTASAGTHWTPATEEVREALQRITESHLLPEEVAAEASAPERITESQGAEPEGEQMDIKTLEQLAAAYPELVNKLREEANPFNAMPEEQRKLAARLAEALRDKPDAPQKDWPKLLKDQADVDRTRLAQLESERTSLAEAVERQAMTLTEVQAELKREKTRSAIREDLSGDWAKGRKGASQILGFVLEEFDAGRVADTTAAKVLAERVEKTAVSVAALGVVQTEAPAKVVESQDSSLTPADKAGSKNKDPFIALVEGAA